MRCLTLANGLRDMGATVTFWADGSLKGAMNTYIEEQGYTVMDASLAGKPDTEHYDWLIVDHYGLDKEWESSIRPYCNNIFVIDDLANRPHDCDLLLDQNYLPDSEDRYNPLVPEHCRLLLGTSYILMRPEFKTSRNSEKSISENVRSILISLGGADPENETQKMVDAVHLYENKNQSLYKTHQLSVNVVVGASYLHKESLQRLLSEYGYTYLERISDMAQRMVKADLFLGAGGTTTWERMAVGLPAAVMSIADNQIPHSVALDRDGYQLYMGKCNTLTSDDISNHLGMLASNQEQRKLFSEKGLELVDADGVKRVCKVLLEI